MKNYRVAVFTENNSLIVDKIISVMNYRNVDVKTFIAEESTIEGIKRVTLDVVTNNSNMNNVVRQLEKNVFVLKAYLLNQTTITEKEEKKILSNFIN